LLTGSLQAGAQISSAESESKSASLAGNGVPIERLIATVAKKTGKKFVVDPRVRANVVLVGEEASELTYPQFLTVLEVSGERLKLPENCKRLACQRSSVFSVCYARQGRVETPKDSKKHVLEAGVGITGRVQVFELAA
jgi:type II secretory pathway component GspD/PulD (secretin)